VLAEVDVHDLRGPAVVPDRDARVGGTGGPGEDARETHDRNHGDRCQRK
jgi:hypothetical protein